MDHDLTKSNIESSISTMLQRAKRTGHCEDECWYVEDLMAAYDTMFPSQGTTPDIFCSILKSLNEYVLVIDGRNTRMSVLSPKRSFNRSRVNEIIARSRTHPERTAGELLFLSEEEDLAGLHRIGPVQREELSCSTLAASFRGEHVNDGGGLGKIKAQIVEAFSEGLVIPISQMHNAFCRTHGAMFDYRKTPCKKFRHPHPTLSKFLRCCEDIVEIKNLQLPYLLKRTSDVPLRIEKQLLVHLKSQMHSKALSYHIELLAVNMFGIRSTLPLLDFLELFRLVYKTSFESLSSAPPAEAINELIRSPNFFAKMNNGQIAVTVVPSFDEAYAEYGDPTFHNLAITAERTCADAPVADGFVDVPSSGIFKDTGIDLLLRIADCNIPRSLQMPFTGYDHEALKSVEMKHAWCYVQQAINLDDRRAFYDL
jgi:hypothetical protein